MNEDLETVPIDPAAEVRPCPFCGAKMYWLGVSGISRIVVPRFWHPGTMNDTDCVLSGRGFRMDEVEAFNRRV